MGSPGSFKNEACALPLCNLMIILPHIINVNVVLWTRRKKIFYQLAIMKIVLKPMEICQI